MTSMFRPTSVTSHKMRLGYNEDTRKAALPPKHRANHGSFPSLRSSEETLAKALIGEAKFNSQKDHSIDYLQAKLTELPTVQTPEALPGDCNVKGYILENITPCE